MFMDGRLKMKSQIYLWMPVGIDFTPNQHMYLSINMTCNACIMLCVVSQLVSIWFRCSLWHHQRRLLNTMFYLPGLSSPRISECFFLFPAITSLVRAAAVPISKTAVNCQLSITVGPLLPWLTTIYCATWSSAIDFSSRQCLPRAVVATTLINYLVRKRKRARSTHPKTKRVDANCQTRLKTYLFWTNLRHVGCGKAQILFFYKVFQGDYNHCPIAQPWWRSPTMPDGDRIHWN